LSHIPLGVLLSSPKNLSPRWQGVFDALALPVAVVRGILRNPALAELPRDDLLAQVQVLRQARAGLERTVNELDGLETVAPQTWKAGYAIRAAFLPVWAILESDLFITKWEGGLPVRQPVSASEWPQVAPHVLARLVKRRDGLDEESLLTGLRDAVVAEKDIDLGRPAPGLPSDGAEAESQPKQYLMNWPEILGVLGRPDNEEERRRIRSLNDTHDGPIIFQGPGSGPKVDKSKLIAWWNRLESRWQEIEQRNADRRETVTEQYPHGRGEIVVPEIAGHVQQRKKKRQD
jgi:hypothetical protein